MNTLKERLIETTYATRTENGAYALNTTKSSCLDFYSVVGALRNANDERIFELFDKAYEESPLDAFKILFYARDLKGLGERNTFRKLLKYVARKHSKEFEPNLELIGSYYGRYDDLYSLMDTPLEDAMWRYMGYQLKFDLENYAQHKPISLLAKWVKTADASSEKTRLLGIKTALKLGYTVPEYKRIYKKLRKYLDVTEVKMTQQRWDEIDYSHVPSRAMLVYRNAFRKHSPARFQKYITDVSEGKAKINSSTLYPYDIVEKFIKAGYINDYYDILTELSDTEIKVLEEQWKALPDYTGSKSAIVIADTSGSMYGRPLNSAISLAIYFAQRNRGVFHNVWMNFSTNPSIQVIKGDTLREILKGIDMRNWGMNTNLEAAFDLILDTAIRAKAPQEDMPESIIVISDMEIDQASTDNWVFYDYMEKKFFDNGYKIPNVVFWNVDSRHDIYHADTNRKGVQLVSGQSTTTFTNIMNSIGMTPYESMRLVLDSDRYAPISVGP